MSFGELSTLYVGQNFLMIFCERTRGVQGVCSAATKIDSKGSEPFLEVTIVHVWINSTKDWVVFVPIPSDNIRPDPM